MYNVILLFIFFYRYCGGAPNGFLRCGVSTFLSYFCTTCLVVEVKASEQLHVLKLWLGVSMAMLPAIYFAPTIPFFVSVFFGRS